MIPDRTDSSHPVERAVAIGRIVDTRIEPASTPNQWLRIRLVDSPVQPRLVRVREHWYIDETNGTSQCLSREMYLADQIIVQISHQANLDQALDVLAQFGNTSAPIANRLFTLRLPRSDLDAVPQALRLIANHPERFVAAEPDGVGFGGGAPNDTLLSQQWGLNNTGQSGGAAGADIRAFELWNIIEGAEGVLVAVLDSGLNFSHPDLLNIAWINPGELPNDGIDNDQNGKVDDDRGWNFVSNNNNPTDDQGHGSHVSGIIAAHRNNSLGIAGVLNAVRILPCKILNAANSGFTSDLIAATTYARLLGAPIMNMSLQNYPYSSALDTEFTACQTAGILLVICAGNQGANNDITPNYPSSYPHPNILSVGNHSRNDVRWAGSFNPSNYGSTRVDLFAPGRDIVSTVLGSSYESWTGTSMSAPFVTAVAAALKYTNPHWSADQIKNAVMSSVTLSTNYAGLCVSGGRLNAARAIAHAILAEPNQDSDQDGFPNLLEYLAGTRIDATSSAPTFIAGKTGNDLHIQMPRTLRPDAHLMVETTTNLLSAWSTNEIMDGSTAQELIGLVSVTNHPERFLRITATPGPAP